MYAHTHCIPPTSCLLSGGVGSNAACQHLSTTQLTIRRNDQTEKKTKERSEKRNRGETANIRECGLLYLLLSHFGVR